MIFRNEEYETLGPALPVKCPMCKQTDLFVLRSWSWSYKGLLTLLLPKGTVYSLDCQHCKYKIDVYEEDIAAAKALVKKAKQFRCGEISRYDFIQFAKANKPSCVEALAAVNSEKTCPNCGEDVPGTFDHCWNCNAELDSANEETAEGSGDDRSSSADEPLHTPSPFGNMRL